MAMSIAMVGQTTTLKKKSYRDRDDFKRGGQSRSAWDVTGHWQPRALMSGPRACAAICTRHVLGECVAHDSRKPRIERLRGDVISVKMAFCALAALGVYRVDNEINIRGKRMGPPNIHYRAIEGGHHRSIIGPADFRDN